MNKTYTPMALKIYAHGLNLLHDPNWTHCYLYYVLMDRVRGKMEPFDILRKTLRKGALYYLGHLIQEEYFNNDYLLETLKKEYRIWYLEDFIEAVVKFDKTFKRKDSILASQKLLKEIDNLCSKDEDDYYTFLNSEDGIDAIVDCYKNVWDEFDHNQNAFMDHYSSIYADKVFHDRQLCSYIAELMVDMGLDGMWSPKDTEPQQWVDRIRWAEWAKKAVRARERGLCAECKRSLVLELQERENIDHIVPLSRGGTNDLVNLQLLCKDCNLKKSNNPQAVTTSVPCYMKDYKKERAK